MKRYTLSLLFLLSCLVLPLPSAAQAVGTRAVWLTTLMGLDWPRQRAKNADGIARQKAELTAIYDKLQAAGINTILFQARIRGTVAYPSDIEPFDAVFSGTAGRSPGYDPLQFALDEAHRRGMTFQAWVVAYPVNKAESVKALGNRALPRKRPELCQRCGEQYMMDPGVPGTAEYIASICKEIVERYDVDGIHLDYIRYPETQVNFDDTKTYRRYGNGQRKADWRRDNVTRTVRAIRQAIDGVRSGVRLSCSPVGKYADLPRQSSKGWNARDAVSQDAVMWLNEGLMDEIYPMMYFDGDHFYPFALDWKEEAQRGKVIPGLGIYFLSKNEKDWDLLRIQRQLHFLKQQGFDGFALFRSKFFTDNTKGLYNWLSRQYDGDDVAKIGECMAYEKKYVPSTHRRLLSADTLSVPKGMQIDARRLELEDAYGRVIGMKKPDETAVFYNLPVGTYTLYGVTGKGARHRLTSYHKGF